MGGMDELMSVRWSKLGMNTCTSWLPWFQTSPSSPSVSMVKHEVMLHLARLRRTVLSVPSNNSLVNRGWPCNLHRKPATSIAPSGSSFNSWRHGTVLDVVASCFRGLGESSDLSLARKREGDETTPYL